MTAYESRLSALPLFSARVTLEIGIDIPFGEGLILEWEKSLTLRQHALFLSCIMMISSSWAPDSQIEYFKGSRCGFENCKSKRYYIEEGFTYCQDGHQQDTVRTLSNSKQFLS